MKNKPVKCPRCFKKAATAKVWEDCTGIDRLRYDCGHCGNNWTDGRL